MAEKVAKVGVKKQKGYLYFVDEKGDVARTKMARDGREKGRAKVEVVVKVGVKKKPGYLYFVDKNGDIAMATKAEAEMAKMKKKWAIESFSGSHITCEDCSYTWQIRKRYSKPLKCYKCGSSNLALLDENEEDDNDLF